MKPVLNFRRTALPALLLSLTLSGCAPDAWRPDSPYEAFLDQVQKQCWSLDIGPYEINTLLNDTTNGASNNAYFLDLTSRMFNGQITQSNYAETLATFFTTKPDSPGIRCILAQMPKDPQRLAPLIKY